MSGNRFFDWKIGRLACAWGSYWQAFRLDDGTYYSKIIGPFYWRENQ